LRDVPEAGVIAASGGNHGVAVAYAAHELGIPAQIFVPTVSAPAKIERIRGLGADLVVPGERYADALPAAEASAAGPGAVPAPAGAVAVAAVRTGAYRAEPGERVAVVVSGANTTGVGP